jgi:WD40 repeat protein
VNATGANFVEPKDLKTISVDPQMMMARYSPCGRVLAGASYDGRVRRWNATTDEYAEIASLPGHSAWCTAVAFRAEGDWLYSADSWGQIRAWNAIEGLGTSASAAAAPVVPRWKIDLAHDGWIRELAVSPDGQLLASCAADKRTRLWSTIDGSPKGEIAGYGFDLYTIRFAPDGQSILTGDDRGIVKQWKLDGSLVREFDARELHTLSRLQDVGGVRAIAISTDGKQLAAGGAIPKNGATITGEPAIFVFDVATGERKAHLKLGDVQDVGFVDLQWHGDGNLLAISNGTPGKGRFVCFRPGEAEPLFQTSKMANCQSLSIRADGKHLAVVATNNGSNANGRALDKDGNYLGNQSPIHLFSLDGG